MLIKVTGLYYILDRALFSQYLPTFSAKCEDNQCSRDGRIFQLSALPRGAATASCSTARSETSHECSYGQSLSPGFPTSVLTHIFCWHRRPQYSDGRLRFSRRHSQQQPCRDTEASESTPVFSWPYTADNTDRGRSKSIYAGVWQQ